MDRDAFEGAGWLANGTKTFPDRRSPYIRLSLRQIIDVLPFISRYVHWWYGQYKKNLLPFIDSFRPLVYKPIYGVPCGGIGAGSIGRGFRGEFVKISLRPGLIEHAQVVVEDQFIVTIRRGDKTIYQQCLSCPSPSAKSVPSWSFGFPPENLQYRGLFPRSWTHYSIPQHNVTLSCRQISPVIPHNYKDSSLPVSVFEWKVHNGSNDLLSISISLAFRNGIGNPKYDSNGNCLSKRRVDQRNDNSQMKYVEVSHMIDSMPCTYALSTIEQHNGSCHTTVRTSWNPTGSGSDLWNDLLDDGQLDLGPEVTTPNVNLGICLCVKSNLKPGEDSIFPICLAWDMPVVAFPSKRRLFKRWYTKWFGCEMERTNELCRYALENYQQWEGDISRWQTPVLSNPDLSDWYKSALFNELYFVVDGGSMWFDFEESWLTEEPRISEYSAKLFKEVGRFGYLESWEYRMINTYDVHFYASFALALLWPKLEHSVQSDFCDQVAYEDATPITFHFEGDKGLRKTKYRVPHDLGNPAQDPFLIINCYEMHNTARWRDLNLKFILQSYRDYLILDKDEEFLRHVWNAVTKLIDVGRHEWDLDGDGMIENSSTCDQTYDAWIMSGTSAYCGGLWLAALQSARKIAKILGHTDEETLYGELLIKAKLAYEKKLWNGEYYKFDENSRESNAIMADQLSGYWYLKACGIEEDVLPKEHVLKSLRKIFDFNVMKFCGGHRGAVNGMTAAGKVDDVCIQSEEVWTGVTYSLAAHMIDEGMVTEGFRTASGIYETCCHEIGLQYQTPEAIYAKDFYRAIGYMRPLAIWAMQWNMDKRNKTS